MTRITEISKIAQHVNYIAATEKKKRKGFKEFVLLARIKFIIQHGSYLNVDGSIKKF